MSKKIGFLKVQSWNEMSLADKLSILVVAGLISLFVYGIFFLDATTETDKGDTKTDETPEEFRDLDATVNYGASGVKVANNEDKDWVNCEMRINYSWTGGGGYVYEAKEPISAKGYVIIPWGNFIGGDSTRFNYLTTEPDKLKITCSVGGKSRSTYLGE